MRARLLACTLVFAGCQCAGVEEGALYACEADGGCPAGLSCVDLASVKLCAPLDGGRAGGSGGGAGGGGGGATAGGGGGDAGCDPTRPDPVDDLGLDQDCDGIDGKSSEAIFVDPVDGRPLGVGTPADPVDTLSTGLARAMSGTGKSHVFVAEGVITEPATLIAGELSIHGGYTRTAGGGWVRNRLAGSGCGDGGRPLVFGAPIALRSDIAGASVVIESLCIVARDADAGASIGLAIVGGADRVTLKELDVTAGNGADGAPGPDGSPGAPGGNGAPGQQAVVGAVQVPGGGGGASPCGVRGGTGGDGRAGGTSPMSGLPGEATDAGPGGTGAQGVQNEYCGSNNDCVCGNTVAAGGGGRDGRTGLDGVPGLPGDGEGLVTAAALWSPVSGSRGDAGLPGAPGSGGGGGGAYRVLFVNYFHSGASGGGAGAGGCPGQGGAGGTSGGASIAALFVNARPTFAGAMHLTAKNGGNGAPGGQGGPGGSGGTGAAGGLGLATYCAGNGIVSDDAGLPDSGLLPGPLLSIGGRGGDGGLGGRGGPGGPGGGGPSVAVWCAGDAGWVGSVAVLVPGAAGSGVGGADAGFIAQRWRCVSP